MYRKWLNKIYFLFILVILVGIYYNFLNKPYPITPVYINHQNSTWKRVSTAHYTTLYGIRTDSHSNIFNENLRPICEVFNPEDYAFADNVFVSLIDLSELPRSTNGISYRHLHQSQLWIVHSEESPRNSYRTVKIKDVKELNDWFNLTSTLKPESDFHIQYRGYRIKPEIGNLLQTKLNLTLAQPNNFTNGSSIYLTTLSSILHREFIHRQEILFKTCPYTCNQPLPSHLLPSLQPYLKEIRPRVLNRDVVYIAWFVSNCNTHSRREDYVDRLRSQKGIHVDIYGHCKSMFHSPLIPIPCEKGTPNCTAKILSNYRFYLSFENSKCDTYITEKYWIQGLNQHAIPIVLGAKREHYQRIAIPNSFIHVDDYPTVEDLTNELHRLNRNDSAYVRYLQWTQLYDVSAEYNSTPGIDMHSTLCLLGHYRYLHSMNEKNKQIKSLMKTIRQIFNLTNMQLPNFNWRTGRTNPIHLSQFYNPAMNCWDFDYPSIFKQIYNYLFTWWKLF